MKIFLQNSILIIMLLLINIALFLLMYVISSPENYIWNFKNIDIRQIELINYQSQFIFRTKYIFYANILNIGLASIYLIFYKKYLWAIIGFLLCSSIFMSYSVFIENKVVDAYFVIFQNQKVSPYFEGEVCVEAGPKITHKLIEEVNKNSRLKIASIRALGVMNAIEAIELLNKILNDWQEPLQTRLEAYKALREIKSEKSDFYTNLFKESMHPYAEKDLKEKINEVDLLLE